jgi:hypothetical protein
MIHGEVDLLAERFEHCGVSVLIVLELLPELGLQQTKCRVLSQHTSREYFAVRSNQTRHLVTTTP